MSFPPFDPAALVGYIGTFIVGGGMAQLATKLVDVWFRQREKKVSTEDELRDELRDRVRELLTQVKAQEKEIDEWREKYFSLREQVAELRAELEVLRTRIEHQGELAKKAAALAQGQSPGVGPA